jgi:hypothetical protein
MLPRICEPCPPFSHMGLRDQWLSDEGLSQFCTMIFDRHSVAMMFTAFAIAVGYF